MKKIVALLISLTIVFSLIACSEPNVVIAADYDNVQDAIRAERSGADLTGKTIRIDMNQDSTAGIIYYKADLSVNANIYVTIITNDSNRNEVLGLKKGDTVVVKVDTYDNHLKNSIYVYAVDYTIY